MISGSIKKKDIDSPKSSLIFCAHARSYGLKIESALRKVECGETCVSNDVSSHFIISEKRDRPKNPFKIDIARFMKNTLSPDVFQNVTSPSEISKNGEFSWSIDDISQTNPADIDSPASVHAFDDEQTDEETEEIIQKTIVDYFQSSQGLFSPSPVIPQRLPMDIPTSRSPPLYFFKCAMSTPTSRFNRITRTSDCGVQTDLTFPPELPEEVMNILKPFFKFSEGEDETGMSNTSINTSRRKLFLCKENSAISPMKFESPEWVMPSSRLHSRGWSPWNSSREDVHMESPQLSPIAGVRPGAESEQASYTHMITDSTSEPSQDVSRNVQISSSSQGEVSSYSMFNRSLSRGCINKVICTSSFVSPESTEHPNSSRPQPPATPSTHHN